MDSISPEIAREIERRVSAGPYRSTDELLRCALNALDLESLAPQWLEEAVLEGLEGEDVELDEAEWDSLEQEALRRLEAKKPK